jgi:hypothetical protein
VVSNIFFPYGIIRPIDSYFSRWLKPPTSYKLSYLWLVYLESSPPAKLNAAFIMIVNRGYFCSMTEPFRINEEFPSKYKVGLDLKDGQPAGRFHFVKVLRGLIVFNRVYWIWMEHV